MKDQIYSSETSLRRGNLKPIFKFIGHTRNSTSVGSACRTAEPPRLNCSTVMFMQRRTDNGYQPTEAGLAYLEVKTR